MKSGSAYTVTDYIDTTAIWALPGCSWTATNDHLKTTNVRWNELTSTGLTGLPICFWALTESMEGGIAKKLSLESRGHLTDT